jgi:hypothetical protein
MNSGHARAARDLKLLVQEWIAAVAAIPRFPDELAELGDAGPSLGDGVDGEVHYFAVDGPLGRRSIFRVRWADDGLWLECRGSTGWRNDPGLLRYFVGMESGARELDASDAEAVDGE